MEDKSTLELLSPAQWEDYELIDSGSYEKLERFGAYVVARPEPQAIWNRSLSERQWEERAHAWFRKDNRGGGSDERGEWYCKPKMAQQWWVSCPVGDRMIKMRLGLTSFKHVGIFPEQASNWTFIYEQITRLSSGALPEGDTPKVLNLFAYTGGVTLAARAAGAEVTHVDSVKQVVSWSRENLEASGLDRVRWMVEDALKFVRREVKRGNTYHGIILDPPAYGRGPDGERWILEENINELLTLCGQLLAPKHSFLVLNLYSMGFSALLARTAVAQLVGEADSEQSGELYFTDSFGKRLPLGVFHRIVRE